MAQVVCFIYFVKVKAEVSKVHCNYRGVERSTCARRLDDSNRLSYAVYLLCVNYIVKQKRIKTDLSQTVNKICFLMRNTVGFLKLL